MDDGNNRSLSNSHIIVNNVLILFTRYLALWGLNGILVLFLPRYLGDQGLGQLQFALSFTALFAIGVTLGVKQFLIKEVARDRSQIRAYLGTAIGLRTITAVVVLAIIVLIVALSGAMGQTRWVIYLATLSMIVMSFAHLMAAFLNGLENMTWPALGEVVNKTIVVAAGIVVLVLGLGLEAYAGVLLAGAAVQFALTAGYVRRYCRLSINFRIPQVRTLIIGGGPFLLMGFLLDLYNHISVVMLRIFTSDAVVGWYAAASQLYHSVDFLPLVFTTALLPTLARVHSASVPDLITIAKKSITIGLAVIVPVSLGISILSEEVITFLPYPDAFQNSVPLLTILALSIPVTALLTIFGTIAIASDRQNAWSLALLGTVLLNVLLNLLLIPYFHRAFNNGAIGTALSALISETFMVMVGVLLMPKGIIDRPTALTLLKVGVSGGLMALIGLLVKRLGLGPVPVVATGAVTYISLVLASKAIAVRDLMFVWDAMVRRLRPIKVAQAR